MVGDNDVEPAGVGRSHQRFGWVQGHQDTMDFPVRRANQEADIVPVFGQGVRGDLLKNVEKILDGRHGISTR